MHLQWPWWLLQVHLGVVGSFWLLQYVHDHALLCFSLCVCAQSEWILLNCVSDHCNFMVLSVSVCVCVCVCVCVHDHLCTHPFDHACAHTARTTKYIHNLFSAFGDSLFSHDRSQVVTSVLVVATASRKRRRRRSHRTPVGQRAVLESVREERHFNAVSVFVHLKTYPVK